MFYRLYITGVYMLLVIFTSQFSKNKIIILRYDKLYKMSFTCKSCTKNFKSKYSLERHASSSCKGQPIINEFKCKYCPKAYTRKWYLQQHEKSCEDKDKVIEILQLKLENQMLKQNNSKTINSHNTSNSNNVTNNNIINNYSFYGMEPLDLSQKRFDSIVENNYTYENYIKLKLVPEVILKFLSNDQDKLVALLTDYNRMKIKCINENLEIETHDPESLVNFCRKSKPMSTKVKEYIDKARVEPDKNEEINKENYIRTNPMIMASSLRSHRNKFINKKKKVEEPNIKFIEE